MTEYRLPFLECDSDGVSACGVELDRWGWIYLVDSLAVADVLRVAAAVLLLVDRFMDPALLAAIVPSRLVSSGYVSFGWVFRVASVEVLSVIW